MHGAGKRTLRCGLAVRLEWPSLCRPGSQRSLCISFLDDFHADGFATIATRFHSALALGLARLGHGGCADSRRRAALSPHAAVVRRQPVRHSSVQPPLRRHALSRCLRHQPARVRGRAHRRALAARAEHGSGAGRRSCLRGGHRPAHSALRETIRCQARGPRLGHGRDGVVLPVHQRVQSSPAGRVDDAAGARGECISITSHQIIRRG